MPSEALEAALRDLLRAVDPQWQPPVLPPVEDETQQRYERIETIRLQLGHALAADPRFTARAAEDVVRAVLLDGSSTSQLVHPLIEAIGRRGVLLRLIEAVENGPCERRASAAAAAYWVRCWWPQDRLFEAARAAGIRSAVELRRFLDEHAQHVIRSAGEIDDLWPRFWRACLATFVMCEDDEIRFQLQTAFPLDSSRYAPKDADLLVEARRIAESAPERFQRLRDGTTGYGAAI
ncbi:hypothetical protein [Actinomadura gamaensis]|uniref:HEAT repeat domain-containing protein n=1 Tax=Actinomadura gamaensis TaxID=1763541 RepID=A0ABV9UAA5_9ACTN